LTAYIDTSVLVAYYCPEGLSAAAEKVICGADAPAISPLTEVEFCSALAIKVRRRELDAVAAERLLSQFRLHLEERRYEVVPVEAKEYVLACDWIARFSTPLRTVDALHLAASFSNGLRLITADRDLARAARHFGVQHQLIS
jgi:predicted nucleic acid-binding protein